jgi:dynein heavy chain
VARLFDSAVTAQTAVGGLAGGGGGGGAKKGGGAGGGAAAPAKTREDTIGELASDILSRVRGEFDLEAVGAKWPVDPKESMNTVLIQELARYNRLIAIVRSTMTSVKAAMKGLVVLSALLEGVANDVFLGRVPDAWKGRSFSSRKPLAAYVTEFLERIRMLEAWIDVGPPPAFWISGFFFTQSFLTGAAQNYARKYVIPIDDVTFDPQTMPADVNRESVKEKPEDGAYVYGMFLEGCRWNYAKGVLDESEPKVLFTPAPTFWLRPCRTAEVRSFLAYSCPLFKTADRRGVLATTGHSSNYVMRVPVPSAVDPQHWILRGVCMLLSLDY